MAYKQAKKSYHDYVVLSSLMPEGDVGSLITIGLNQ